MRAGRSPDQPRATLVASTPAAARRTSAVAGVRRDDRVTCTSTAGGRRVAAAVTEPSVAENDAQWQAADDRAARRRSDTRQPSCVQTALKRLERAGGGLGDDDLPAPRAPRRRRPGCRWSATVAERRRRVAPAPRCRRRRRPPDGAARGGDRDRSDGDAARRRRTLPAGGSEPVSGRARQRGSRAPSLGHHVSWRSASRETACGAGLLAGGPGTRASTAASPWSPWP